MDDELSPSERARDRRRDRRARAADSALMRTGTAKVFKQILDRQAARAAEDVIGAPEHSGSNATSRDGPAPDATPLRGPADEVDQPR